MAGPYYKYDAPADSASIARPSFHDYMSSEAPSLSSHQPLGCTDLLRASPDFIRREINPMRSGAYGSDDTAGIGVPLGPSVCGITAVHSLKGYSPPVQDPSLIGQRRDVSLGVSPPIPDMIIGVPGSVRNTHGSPLMKGESNVLFVDGLPNDCTRREVSHLFRPFIGYREIRVIHKEPRHAGDKALVLCFVEFIDSKCARTALDALHGYKFDDKKPEYPSLRIQFAHFPFHLPSDGDKKRIPC